MKTKEACKDYGGDGKVTTMPCTWTVDARERIWARTYIDYVDTECDTCEGIGYLETEEADHE